MLDEIRIEDIWNVELSILDEFVRVCDRTHLRYSLAYGTLLGAVRHKGFIPWDDDIDVMMPREDYEKLIELWPNESSDGFVLDDCEQQPDSTNNFSKIRKDHTTFLQFEQERSRTYPKGFFIDIFPADRVAPGKLSRKIQYVCFAMNLLFFRGYNIANSGIINWGEKLLLKMVPRRAYHAVGSYFGKRSRRWNENKSASYILPATIQDCKLFFPSNLFESMHQVCFQGRMLSSPKDTDTVLKILYGDYHKLPPAEERVWKHHPLLIDFTRNYEELTNEEQHQTQFFTSASGKGI